MAPAASPIVFLDVEAQDRTLVLERFPDAAFAPAGLSEDALVDACKDAEIVSTFVNVAFPRTVIARLPKLKLLCTRSVGYDHVDLDTCEERGIAVCNVPDYGSHVIAEHVFALLLSTMRHIHEGSRRVAGGDFTYHGLRGMSLKGKTLGIVGTGKIGRAVARIAWGFGMRILATDRCRTIELEEFYGIRYVPLEDLLAASDIVTLHIPGSGPTKHLISAKELARMKPGSVLVNTARGSLVDSTALLASLESGHLSHALLDVLENEQDAKGNRALVQHKRVVATPHIAFYADDSMRNMFLDCFQSIEAWRAGTAPAHQVHPLKVVCDLPALKAKKA